MVTRGNSEKEITTRKDSRSHSSQNDSKDKHDSAGPSIDGRPIYQAEDYRSAKNLTKEPSENVFDEPDYEKLMT
eukprot:UN12569